MNLLSETGTEAFSFLSIGLRGVGKTVFLAGSYKELHLDRQNEIQQLWFESQNIQEQRNIESICNYVAQTDQYPPPTVNITDFSFSVKHRSLNGTQTLCSFRLWDIPGEICHVDNVDFKAIMTASQGCCVFIDAYALVQNNTYLQTLDDIVTLVESTADLVSLNGLEYAFALILTKCDLIEPSSFSEQQLLSRLHPLTTRLDAQRANYQIFYSHIPIVQTAGASTLRPKGAAAPLLWLVLELSKAHNPSLRKNLLELVTPLLPNNLQPQNLVDGPQQRLFSFAGIASKVKNILGTYLLSGTRTTSLLVLAIVGLVGITSPLFVNYRQLLQDKTQDLDALMENISTLEQHGQFNQVLTLMEKLVQQKPESLELRLHLAQLYQLTGQVSKAETTYDQILVQHKNNFNALIGKAVLRSSNGDPKKAEALFAQAEETAPTDLKAQVHAIAQKTLKSPHY